MSVQVTILALLTGLIAGGVFSFLEIPIPAPPELSGVMGIVGIFAGYQLVQYVGVSVDLLEAIGL